MVVFPCGVLAQFWLQIRHVDDEPRVDELTIPGLLFYGCSYRFHLSGDNSRDRYIKGS